MTEQIHGRRSAEKPEMINVPTIQHSEIVDAMSVFVALHRSVEAKSTIEAPTTMQGQVSCAAVAEMYPSDKTLNDVIGYYERSATPKELWISEVSFVFSVIAQCGGDDSNAQGCATQLLAEAIVSFPDLDDCRAFLFKRGPNLDAAYNEPCCGLVGNAGCLLMLSLIHI
eukprot:TRINITY_DN2584_c0_g1_i3.p1 TRINITY_DN2584_c0_g1~~TRINITY_DN2584_c0_g1_i3.p1  ORF type:complete len:169 (+),score=41.24 TRINITY_DN2584_c0_g1_i3:570-1076(+)